MTKYSVSEPARPHTRLLHLLSHIVLIVLGISFLIPLLWLASTSLKRGAEVFVVPVQWLPTNPQWHNYVEIFERLPFALFILNTTAITIMGALGSVVSSLFVGFSLARLKWPGRNLIFIVLLATMMLPPTVLLVPTFVMFKYIGWLDTFYPLFVPSWFGTAFYIFLMRQFMMGLPIELDEAARIDGASSMRILWQLIAPLSGPAVAAVAIFSFLAHYNDFMDPLIYLTSNEKFTVALGLYWFAGKWGNSWHLVMAASMVTIAPTLILFFLAQRYFVQGIQFSGLTGR